MPLCLTQKCRPSSSKLRDGQVAPITKLAFEFLILTAVRTTEARKARWDEVDWQAKTWTIPGNDAATGRRMKTEREHVVPLSARCLEILEQARGLSKDHELIFPDSDSGRVMPENRFLVARDALGYGKDRCTPHGFRSSFRDWAAEETNFPSEVVEMALAHAIPNKIEAAYRRGHLLAKRFALMEAWAAFACPLLLWIAPAALDAAWYTGGMDDQNIFVAPGRDLSRQDATDNDTDFSLSLEEVAERYERAGHPRTLRSLQRYCASGHLDARKIATTTGDKYLVTPQSVARHIAQIEEFSQLDAVATGRDVSRPVATIIAPEERRRCAANARKWLTQLSPTERDRPRQRAWNLLCIRRSRDRGATATTHATGSDRDRASGHGSLLRRATTRPTTGARHRTSRDRGDVALCRAARAPARSGARRPRLPARADQSQRPHHRGAASSAIARPTFSCAASKRC